MPVHQLTKLNAQKGANFSALNTGKFADLDHYKLEVPSLNRTVSGKLFINEFLGLTSAEISLNKLPAGIAIPFLHQHKDNEEIYIFTGGSGQIQVDEQVIDVEEGSIVRISPKGSRSIRNNSTSDLFYICIQAKQGSLGAAAIEDGVRVDAPVVWPD